MVFQELTPRQVEALSFLVTSFPRTRYITHKKKHIPAHPMTSHHTMSRNMIPHDEIGCDMM